MKRYLEADQESGKRFYQTMHNKGKIVMLNLLKYRDVANYEGMEDLKPETEISGEEAYQLYMKFTMPELEKAGSKILYFGTSAHFLIGPKGESWDAVLLVEHESVSKFMEFASNENYLKTAGHRKAALLDSRLLPSLAYD